MITYLSVREQWSLPTKRLFKKSIKLSGQRWTLKGAQQVVNLRIKLKNNEWDKLVSQIKMAA